MIPVNLIRYSIFFLIHPHHKKSITTIVFNIDNSDAPYTISQIPWFRHETMYGWLLANRVDNAYEYQVHWFFNLNDSILKLDLSNLPRAGHDKVIRDNHVKLLLEGRIIKPICLRTPTRRDWLPPSPPYYFETARKSLLSKTLHLFHVHWKDNGSSYLPPSHHH